MFWSSGKIHSGPEVKYTFHDISWDYLSKYFEISASYIKARQYKHSVSVLKQSDNIKGRNRQNLRKKEICEFRVGLVPLSFYVTIIVLWWIKLLNTQVTCNIIKSIFIPHPQRVESNCFIKIHLIIMKTFF